MLARTRTDVDDMVGDADRLLVVLDDDDGVAEIAESQQRVDEPLVVALVQADRRLVEHVEHADEPAADLRGEPDALCLTARQGGRRAVEAQVVEAHVEEEPEPLVDLLLDPRRNHAITFGQLEGPEELRRPRDRQLPHLEDALVADRHRERRRAQTGATTRGAGHLPHVALDLLAGAVALRVRMAPFQPGNHAFELRRVRALPAVAVAVRDLHRRVAGSVEHGLAITFAQLLPRRVEGESAVVGDRREHAVEVLAPEAGPRRDRTLAQGQVVVRDDETGVDLVACAEAIAALACAVGRVEREIPGCELVERESAVCAGEVLREGQRLRCGLPLRGHDLDLGDPLREAERGLERIGEAPLDAGTPHEAVDDDFDRVLLVAGEARRAPQLDDLTIDPRPGEALLRELGQEPLVLPLATAHDGRQHLEAGADGELEDPVDDLLGSLAGDHPAAGRAVRHPDPRVEQPEVVVDLRDRADRRARIAGGGLLVDRDRR